jgi:cyclopropane-fatty-acyl-phospholipid synthase
MATPRGVAYLATAPGSLGLARRTSPGDLVVHGLHPGDPISAAGAAVRPDSAAPPGSADDRPRSSAAEPLDAGSPDPAAAEALPDWRRWLEGIRHSRSPRRRGDPPTITTSPTGSTSCCSGPSMTYTCACYPHRGRDAGGGAGDKYDLVAASSRCSPGMRLLDVGCGWGGMVRTPPRTTACGARRHAVPRAGDVGPGAIERQGLATSPRCATCDYRDVREPASTRSARSA